jgi:hypothetical protein
VASRVHRNRRSSNFQSAPTIRRQHAEPDEGRL